MRTDLSIRTGADDAELERLERELERRWAELERPRVRPIRVDWPQHSLLVLERGVPWWLGPAEHDPMRDRKGRLPLPRAVHDKLQELATLDLPIRRVAVAHQLAPTGLTRTLRPGQPVACSADTARMLVGTPPPHPGVVRAARALERLVGGTSSAAARIAGTVLDPIVFGVAAPREPRPGDATVWFPLIAWWW